MDYKNREDGPKISKSSIIFLLIITFATVSDGYNISVVGYVAPALMRNWNLAPAALVPVFLAGIFGLILGAPCLGYVGDNLGRKLAIIIALSSFGFFTLVAAFSTNINEILVLRFLSGLGLGGLFPNAIALAVENAPRRFRGMFITIVNFGIPAGFALPGLVSALLEARFGWPALLFVGAALPIFAAIIIAIFLKAGTKFHVHHEMADGKLAQSAPAGRGQGALAKLLYGTLAIITPAIWIALAMNQFTNFFALNWLPTILEADGLSAAQAGITVSMFSIGGMVGGIVLLLAIDRFGFIPIVVLSLVGGPLILAIGIPHISSVVLAGIMAGAGFCVTGVNFGINAAVGMIYPTKIRSIGVGYAQAAGRLGALAAQVVGGVLLAKHISTKGLFVAPAFSLLIGAISSGVVLLLCVRQFSGYRLFDASSEDMVSLQMQHDRHQAIEN